ncbi:hypothetical protein Pla110_31510 [Polystyrenella longa]|uniref:DUF8091 domain-containing protein n=1 Tax=Polystyrenella longa TaxID=2528007 RepID=A0A518CQD3_9PLAN|nr:hypothetical protein [Polystyrenella longa]QDU81410.1 hypothetical protein Pla110_31510 [Polystyrenella longa]
METSLHQQLKQHYAGEGDQIEVRLGDYIIDVISGDELIEVQCASLSAIRDKIRDLLSSHTVRVVKPLAARKYLVRKKARGNKVLSARYSPTRQTWIDVFDELVHFVTVFPHESLILEIAMVELEEHRVPMKRKGWRKKDYRTTDRFLKEVTETRQLRTAHDLWDLLPETPTGQFTTAELAKAVKVPRWNAQKIAYCLRETGCIQLIGKRGKALLYEYSSPVCSQPKPKAA